MMADEDEQHNARGPHCRHPHHEGDIGRRRPGRVRMLTGLTSHIACENRAAHTDSARRAIRRR